MKRINNTLYNVLDTNTKEDVTYEKVTTLPNGTTINDSHCDGIIYRKLGTEYFKRVFPNGIINIEVFGGKGDGITDNTLPLQSAIDYLYNQRKDPIVNPLAAVWTRSGTIYFPEGTFLFTDTVYLTEGTVIRGAGRSATVMLADMKNSDNTRSAANKSLFVTGKESTSDHPGDKNGFYNFSITSTYADGSNDTTPTVRWTLKNGIELHNGFYRIEDMQITGADGYGIYAYELIGSSFDRIYITACGDGGMYLAYPLTHGTTSTIFTSCAFRATRRGPGVKIVGEIISTSFISCLFEENANESAYYGSGHGIDAEGLTYTGSGHMSLNIGFYGCDFERNRGSKVHAKLAHLYFDENCRYTGLSLATPTAPDFYFEDCSIKFESQNYGGNTTSDSFHIVSTDTDSSIIDITANSMPLSYFRFFDTSDTEHDITWLRQCIIQCVSNSGTEDVRYEGQWSTLNVRDLIIRQSLPTSSGSFDILTRNSTSNKVEKLGFVPESSSNKSDNQLLGSSTTAYPTQNAVKNYVDARLQNSNSPTSTTDKAYTVAQAHSKIVAIANDAVSFTSTDVTLTMFPGSINQYVIYVNASSNPVNVTLPSEATIYGGNVRIVKVDSSSNTVTVTSTGSLINGASSISISGQYETLEIASHNTTGVFARIIRYFPTQGVSGSFTSSDGKTITVTNGLITSIVGP